MLLGTEIRFGSVTLRNRIVSAPMERNYGNPDGTLTAAYTEYLEARASGGAALVYTEATYVSPEGRSRPRQLGITGDEHIAGLAGLAARVHDAGALLGVQLMHGGRTSSRRVSGLRPLAASAIPLDRPYADLPDEASTADVERILRDFRAGAARARAAGVDVLSIHGAHGYLVHSFMSPLTNRRTDRFGDPVVFLTEVLDAVLDGAGDVPVGVRISAFEGNPGGLSTSEQLEIFAAARPERLAFVDVSAGNYESPQWMAQSGEFPRGGLAEFAAPYRRFGIPVGVAGRIADPATAEGILERGQADYLSLARALHADPEVPRRWIEGRDYRPCIACNMCADDLGVGAVRCSVNAWAAGGLPALPVPARPLRVLVVGGGPSGLECARLAAQAGHRVELVEQRQSLGGQFRLAARLVGVPEYHRILDWYARELGRLGVVVTLGRRFDAGDVAASTPDAVLVATGAVGVRSSVSDPAGRIVDVREWLAEASEPPEHLTILGEDREALAVAYHQARAGRRVRIISEGEVLAPHEGARAKLLSGPFVAASPLVEHLRRTLALAVGPDVVTALDAVGATRTVDAPGDVVSSAGTTVERALYDDLMRTGAPGTVLHVSARGGPSETFWDAMVAAGLTAARLAQALR